MTTGPSHLHAPYGGYISRWPPWGAFLRPRPLDVVPDSSFRIPHSPPCLGGFVVNDAGYQFLAASSASASSSSRRW